MSQDKTKQSSPSDSQSQIRFIMGQAEQIQKTLAAKLEEFENISREKSVKAQKDILTLKGDLEEIKKLSSINSKPADDEMKAKIQEVNKKVDEIAKHAAQEQAQAAQEYSRVIAEIREIAAQAIADMKNRSDVPAMTKKKYVSMIEKIEKESVIRGQNADLFREELEEDALGPHEHREDEWETKEDLMRKVDYYLIVLSSQCPGIVIEGHTCAAAARNSMSSESRARWK